MTEKGIRAWEEIKDNGQPLINREDMFMPEKSFQPIDKKYGMKCFEKFKLEDQQKVFDDFIKKPNKVKETILINRMNVSKKKCERKRRGKGMGNNYDRAITVSYFI